MQEPKISLIIPAYNEEKYISECLRHAIENSGGKFFEIIVIDNASTDRTREIAESNLGVRVVREEKKGLTRARERGFKEAKGDVLAYIDADTKMPSGWYESVVREFTNDSNLACLSGPYMYYDVPPHQRFFVKMYWYLAVPFYKLVGYMVVGGNFAIRRDVLEKMNGFDTSIEFFGEDTNIARRASEFGKVRFKLSHAMHTSGRRFFGQGFLRTAKEYVINFLSEVLRHKPATKNYTDVR